MPSCHFLTGLRGLEIHSTKLASSWSNNLNSQSVSCSSAGKCPATRATTRVLTLYQTRYLYWRCQRTSWKPCGHSSELEKGDSHAFLFEPIVRPTYPQKWSTFTKKKRRTCEMIPLARTNGDNMGGPRVMKAPLRKVKCQTHGHFGRVFLFFFLHAYTTSNLRTFRRTCVHVRKECSLETSVGGDGGITAGGGGAAMST